MLQELSISIQPGSPWIRPESTPMLPLGNMNQGFQLRKSPTGKNGKASSFQLPKRRESLLLSRNASVTSQATDDESVSGGGGKRSSSNSRDATFPMKLHAILSDPQYEDIITWLPHGKSWRIIQQKSFEERVIPKFFRHGRFSSFARQVNGWGFKRIATGEEYNSYFHELFLRGKPELCSKMKRVSAADHAKQQKLDQQQPKAEASFSSTKKRHRDQDHRDSPTNSSSPQTEQLHNPHSEVPTSDAAGAIGNHLHDRMTRASRLAGSPAGASFAAARGGLDPLSIPLLFRGNREENLTRMISLSSQVSQGAGGGHDHHQHQASVGPTASLFRSLAPLPPLSGRRGASDGSLLGGSGRAGLLSLAGAAGTGGSSQIDPIQLELLLLQERRLAILNRLRSLESPSNGAEHQRPSNPPGRSSSL